MVALPALLVTMKTTKTLSSSRSRSTILPLAAALLAGRSRVRLSSVLPLATSRKGLDPAANRFAAPLVYHENYSFDDWPENHTFPMDKFARIAEALLTTCKSTHSESSLPRPLVRRMEDFYRPLDLKDIPTEDWFCGPIDSDFFGRFLRGQLSKEECRHIGFREQTSRPELIERTLLEVAGTVLTAQLALRYGLAANVAGGTHHAHMTGGAGYTILNDLAVTAHVLTTKSPGVARVLVVDCDVHQGDGVSISRPTAFPSFIYYHVSPRA